MTDLLKVPRTKKGVDTLNSILSAATQLIYELRRDGYDLPLSALTVSECADAVMSAI